MKPAQLDPFEIATLLARALQHAQIPYAIGGAIAYGVWGDPRGTMDVDINLFVTHDAFPNALDVLIDAGVEFEWRRALQADLDGDVIIGWFNGVRIDCFTPSIPFAWEANETAVCITGESGSARYLSAEATCVFKLLFFRPKDLLDVEKVVAVQREQLNVGYVRRWLVEMMGEEDERVAALDRMIDCHLSERD